MYRAIIKIKDSVPINILEEVRSICISAYNNRVGKVEIKQLSEHCFIFEGEEKDYECLQLVFLTLEDFSLFMESVESWKWEDEDPDESCDLLDISLKYKV